MKWISLKLIIFFISPFVAQALKGQEANTVSVYFEYAKWELNNVDKNKIDELPIQSDSSVLETIILYGYTDSIGSIKGNIKLANRRIQAVIDYLEIKWPNYPFVFEKVIVGEKPKGVETNDRRVDIELIFSGDVSIAEITKESKLYYCKRCEEVNIRFTEVDSSRKGEFKLIYMDQKSRSYFWVKDKDSAGYQLEKCRWRTKRLEANGFSKVYYYTTIPKLNYEKYGMLRVSQDSGKGCKLSIEEAFSPSNVDSILVPNHFIMDQIKLRRRFLSLNKFKARLPKSAISGQEIYDAMGNKINFTISIRKRKKEFVYYSFTFPWKAQLNRTNPLEFYKKVPFICAPCVPFLVKDKLFRCNGSTNCGGCLNYVSGIPFSIIADLNRQTLYNENIHSFSLGIADCKLKYNWQVLAGINQFIKPSFRANFEYTPINLPSDFLIPTIGWRSYESAMETSLFQIKIGGEVRYWSQTKPEQILGLKAYTGLNYLVNKRSIVHRVYLNYGIGFNSNNAIFSSRFSYVDLGIQFNIYDMMRRSFIY